MRIVHREGETAGWKEDKAPVRNEMFFPHIGCHVMSHTGQSLEIFENKDGTFRIVSDCVESVSIIKKEKKIEISEKISELQLDGEENQSGLTRKWEEIHISTKCGNPDANMDGD